MVQPCTHRRGGHRDVTLERWFCRIDTHSQEVPAKLKAFFDRAAVMLNFSGMRFPKEIILVCIRWYAAYPLSYRHLEEMMEERGVSVDHSTVNR